MRRLPWYQSLHFTELKYYLDKAERTQGISLETPCCFYSERTEREHMGLPESLTSGPALGLSDEESADILQNTASPDILKLWPWVNQVRKCELLLDKPAYLSDRRR